MSTQSAQQLNKELSDHIRANRWKTNPFASGEMHISRTVEIYASSPHVYDRTKGKNIKIAAVSLAQPNCYSTESYLIACKHHLYKNSRANSRNLVLYGAHESNKLTSNLFTGIRKSIKHGADIICVNELGFPQDEKGRPCQIAIEWLYKTANDKKIVIISGSLHDHCSKYNTCYIFYPGCDKQGYQYHKQVSAVTVQENINVPSERISPAVTIFGKKFAVLTCLDIADYSSVVPIIRTQCDFLLVPTLTNKFDRFNNLARDISSALPGGLMFANHLSDEVDSSRLTLFGKIKPPDTTEQIRKSSGKISIYNIDLDEFNRQQTDHNSSGNARLNWLFQARHLRSEN